MYIYLRSSNSLHSILAFVLCKTWSNIDSNSMLRGSAVFISIRVFPYYVFGNFHGTTWYGSANRSSCARNFQNKDGALHPSTCWLSFLQTEGIWTNYVDIEPKIMKVRFIIFLSTWGYNSLGDPTRQHKVWRKTRLNTYWSNRNFGKMNIPSD